MLCVTARDTRQHDPSALKRKPRQPLLCQQLPRRGAQAPVTRQRCRRAAALSPALGATRREGFPQRAPQPSAPSAATGSTFRRQASPPSSPARQHRAQRAKSASGPGPRNTCAGAAAPRATAGRAPARIASASRAYPNETEGAIAIRSGSRGGPPGVRLLP
eukprot:scaffold303_cov410-Prasinococcus_capsulatus_cf.AAC.9